MRITKVELKNFKRFTDLTIDGIPADAKLVLLIGSNGSGKSSVFDAFQYVNNISKNGKVQLDRLFNVYFKKQKSDVTIIHLTYADSFEDIVRDDLNPQYFSLLTTTPKPNAFYGRSSLRQLPRLTRTTMGTITDEDIRSDTDRPKLFIERDNRFENDVERISDQVLVEVFQKGSSGQQINDAYVDPINRSLGRIFDTQNDNKLSLTQIIPPLAGKPAQLTFQKGGSTIQYDYLSSGEKEIINVLLNLLVRKDQYSDTIYFFDELDLHLNTQLQSNLLKEITENWLPDNCQLWTASHSLGFIDYARQYEHGVIVDFDDLDFDQPQTLFPQSKERLDVYDIAVPKEMLFEIMKGKKVIVCENKNDDFYNLLGIPDAIFVGVNNSRDVFLKVKRDLDYSSIRDRDFISDAEIDYLRQQYPNHHILTYYCFENYLYHPDNVAEIALEGFDYEDYAGSIRNLKNERYPYILPSVVSARQRYEEFNNDQNLNYKDTDSIVDDFRSDELERFYKYFSMKGQHEKVYPALGKVSQKRLVQTKWFRQQIEAVLNQ